MQYRRWGVTVIANLVTCFTAAVSAAAPPTEIERRILQAMDRWGIPALSIAVVVRGQFAWARGYGWADLENRVPATEHTVYRLASISKPITAVAVMQLVERGRLDLDAPIQRYCPAFPPKRWTLTARHLLAHMGGIRHYRSRTEFNSTRHYRSVQEALAIFRDEPLLFEPGTRFHYTTYGYNLLGCAIEGASGMSYGDYIRTHIFQPAGMTTACIDDLYAIIPHRARGYQRDRNGRIRNADLADTSNKIPGGGLCGTVVDLARFAVALMTGRLVRPETQHQMLTPQRTHRGIPVPYGFGWRLSRYRDWREAWHTGTQQGASGILYMIPEQKLAVAILTNLERVPERLSLVRSIATLLLSQHTPP